MRPYNRRSTKKLESKELTVYFSADLQRIEPDMAYLLVGDHEVPVKAQHIFVKIGAEMPRGFLEQCGVTFASQDPEASAAPGCPLPGRGARPVSGWFSGREGSH